MDPAVLTARVKWQDGRYLATIQELGLEGEGDTAEAAQNDLINLVRNWIEVQDSRGLLEEALAQAGLPGCDEESELELWFEEPSLEPQQGCLDKIVYQIEESQEGDHYLAYCPELVITGFGDTAEGARESLRKEIGAYLEDCETLGILDDVLIDAGFYDNDEVWMSSLVTPPREPRIDFL